METVDTKETSGGAHQGIRRRLVETEGDYGDWRDCRDQWRCSPRDKSERQMEIERDYGDWRDCGDQWRCFPRDKKSERQVETERDYH